MPTKARMAVRLLQPLHGAERRLRGPVAHTVGKEDDQELEADGGAEQRTAEGREPLLVQRLPFGEVVSSEPGKAEEHPCRQADEDQKKDHGELRGHVGRPGIRQGLPRRDHIQHRPHQGNRHVEEGECQGVEPVMAGQTRRGQDESHAETDRRDQARRAGICPIKRRRGGRRGQADRHGGQRGERVRHDQSGWDLGQSVVETASWASAALPGEHPAHGFDQARGMSEKDHPGERLHHGYDRKYHVGGEVTPHRHQDHKRETDGDQT